MIQVNAFFRNSAAEVFVLFCMIPRADRHSGARSMGRRVWEEMSREEMDYLERRAEEEIELAQRAEHARAVQAHYQMASAYLDRLHGDTPVAGPNPFNI